MVDEIRFVCFRTLASTLVRIEGSGIDDLHILSEIFRSHYEVLPSADIFAFRHLWWWRSDVSSSSITSRSSDRFVRSQIRKGMLVVTFSVHNQPNPRNLHVICFYRFAPASYFDEYLEPERCVLRNPLLNHRGNWKRQPAGSIGREMPRRHFSARLCFVDGHRQFPGCQTVGREK